VRSVITVGGPSKRLDLASAWGATETLDVMEQSSEERLDRVRSLTGGRGADVVIEVSGAPPAFAEGVDLLRRGGRFVVVGQLHTEMVPFNPSQIVTKQATIIGSVSADISHYERGLRFLVEHRDSFAWDDLVDSRHTLDTVNEALREMRSHAAIKPVLQFA
jgi:threonine dehydrogenase-like Zn-dependent dehydrogenase